MVASVPELTSLSISIEGTMRTNRFGEFDFAFGGRAEAGAAFESLGDGLYDFGVAVAEEKRSPGTDVVNVLIAIGIIDAGTLASDDEARGSAYAAPGADRGVHASGYG